LSAIVEREPDNPVGHRCLGQWYLEAKDPDTAKQHFLRAAELKPDDPGLWLQVAMCEASAGRYEQAVTPCRRALEIKPDFAEAMGELANALEMTGRLDEALATYQRLIEIAPDQVKAQRAVVNLLDGRGDRRGAIEWLRRAHQSLLDDLEIANDLAWRLATCPDAELRNGDEAVALAEQANKATDGQVPEILDTLAAAYAEVGRFDAAVSTADRAIQLADKADRPDLASRIAARRSLYAQGEPYRDR
jgi:tetratricopeptide (TPR) repeat protein